MSRHWVRVDPVDPTPDLATPLDREWAILRDSLSKAYTAKDIDRAIATARLRIDAARQPVAETALREALREAYTLLVSAEPAVIRDSRTAPNATSAHYKALLRDRIAEWLAPYRDHFDDGLAALATREPDPVPLDVRRVVRAIENVAKRHHIVKDPPPPTSLARIYGYSTTLDDMDAQIAAEYARLSQPDATEEAG